MSDPAQSLTVGVVGAGTMGAGIAQVCLQAGHEVVVYDVDEAAVAGGLRRIADGLDRLVSKGRLTADERQTALDRLREAYTLESVAGGSVVEIEAALENL